VIESLEAGTSLIDREEGSSARKFLTSRRRRYALAFVVGASLGVMVLNVRRPRHLRPRHRRVEHRTDIAGLGVTSGGCWCDISDDVHRDQQRAEHVGTLATALQGGNSSEFQIPIPGPNNTCANNTVAAGDTCIVKARFDPSALGPLSSSVVVTGDPADGTATATLTGTGAP
jgi:hypothetical protein